MPGPRDESRYGRGHEDGLEALSPLDLGAASSVDALVRAMSDTAFGGRRLGEAADVLEAMVRDPKLSEEIEHQIRQRCYSPESGVRSGKRRLSHFPDGGQCRRDRYGNRPLSLRT